MIQVFCKEKGSGKTKALMNLANSKGNSSKGNLVYIDDDTRGLLRIHKNIRFICSKDFNIHNYKDFYGFICGIISKDYDVESIFIDGVLSDICNEENNIPDTIKKYVV